MKKSLEMSLSCYHVLGAVQQYGSNARKKTPIKLLKGGRLIKLGPNALLGSMTQYPGTTELQGLSRPLSLGLPNTEV